MPTYEYECGSCGHILESFQKISDDPLKKCPSCGEDSLRRLLSATAFHLKGSGWYKTDYASSSNGASEATSTNSNDTSKDSKKETSDKGSEKKAEKSSETKDKKASDTSSASGSNT